MTDPRERFRRSLILDGLIVAVQAGKMTHSEMRQAKWLLNYTGWELNGCVGAPTELVAKIRAACPQFDETAAEIPSSQIEAVQPPKLAKHVDKFDPNIGFGLQQVE